MRALSDLPALGKAAKNVGKNEESRELPFAASGVYPCVGTIPRLLKLPEPNALQTSSLFFKSVSPAIITT